MDALWKAESEEYVRSKNRSLGKKDETQRYDSPSSSNAGCPLFSSCALTAYRLSTREGEGSLPGRKTSSEFVLGPGRCKGLARDGGQSHLCWTHYRYTRVSGVIEEWSVWTTGWAGELGNDPLPRAQDFSLGFRTLLLSIGPLPGARRWCLYSQFRQQRQTEWMPFWFSSLMGTAVG